MKEIIIAVDFDGTCVTHEYPEVGADIPYCVEVLKRLQRNNVKIILWTMRSGKALDDVVNWFKYKEIELFGINENPQQKEWTASPKAYAQIYIDDAALGCPLLEPHFHTRGAVNWVAVENILEKMGVFLIEEMSLLQTIAVEYPDKVSPVNNIERLEEFIKANNIPERKISDALNCL